MLKRLNQNSLNNQHELCKGFKKSNSKTPKTASNYFEVCYDETHVIS